MERPTQCAVTSVWHKQTRSVTEACAHQSLSVIPGLSQDRPIFVTREMARLEGFEPPTNGFGSHYSIRLSYRRVFKGLFLPRPDVLSSGRWDIPNACWGE